MKIKEFAEDRCLTQGAIYKAIMRDGHTTKQLTDKRGDITAEGFRILYCLYPEEEYPPKPKEPDQKEARQTILDDLEEKNRLIESLREALREAEADKSTIDDLRGRLRAAQEQAEKWERLYLELQEQSARERAEHREELREAHIIASQALHRNPLKRLFGRKKAQEAEGSIT